MENNARALGDLIVLACFKALEDLCVEMKKVATDPGKFAALGAKATVILKRAILIRESLGIDTKNDYQHLRLLETTVAEARREAQLGSIHLN